MFSLIITIISIALVAALALATLYYGGDAFNQGRAGATASQLINEGQQVVGAVTIAEANGNLAAADTIGTLVTKTYLSQAPANFVAATVVGAGAPLVVTGAIVTADVCDEVQKRAVGPAAVATSQADAPTDQIYGCFLDSDATTADTPTFFFNL